MKKPPDIKFTVHISLFLLPINIFNLRFSTAATANGGRWLFPLTQTVEICSLYHAILDGAILGGRSTFRPLFFSVVLSGFDFIIDSGFGWASGRISSVGYASIWKDSFSATRSYKSGQIHSVNGPSFNETLSFSLSPSSETDYISSWCIRFKNFFDCQGVFLLPFPSFSFLFLVIEFQTCEIRVFDSKFHVKWLIFRACLIKIHICVFKILAKDFTFKVSFFSTCFNCSNPCLIIYFFRNSRSNLFGSQSTTNFISLYVGITNRSVGCPVKNEIRQWFIVFKHDLLLQGGGFLIPPLLQDFFFFDSTFLALLSDCIRLELSQITGVSNKLLDIIRFVHFLIYYAQLSGLLLSLIFIRHCRTDFIFSVYLLVGLVHLSVGFACRICLKIVLYGWILVPLHVGLVYLHMGLVHLRVGFALNFNFIAVMSAFTYVFCRCRLWHIPGILSFCSPPFVAE